MKGRTEPRIFTPPLRKLTPETSLGFAFAEFCEHILGVKLLPWQEWLGIHALELMEDGSFRYRTVVVLVARQCGKSLVGKCLALFFMYVLRAPLVLGTAQSLDTAEEVWDGAVDMAEGIDELRAEIEKVSRRNGGKALVLNGGEAYKISAATRGGARGKTCDLVLMDEIREQVNWDAWGAISGTITARPNALIWTMSNAGDVQSVVLRHLRTQAHAAIGDPDGIAAAIGEVLPDPEDEGADALLDGTIGIFEWSAPPGCDLTDPEALEQANPSLGYGFLTERSLLAQIRLDPEPVARTEHLCQWVEAVVVAPFPEGAWNAGTDKDSAIPATEPIHYGIDMSDDRTHTAIAACGMRADGLWHVEVVAYRVGFDWALEWFRQRAAKQPMTVGMQARGCPIASYIADLEAIDGLTVAPCEGRDLGAWAGRFYDAVAACGHEAESDATPVMHRPQPLLDHAAEIAQKRNLGDGAWGWDRKNSIDDISPLVAASMAFGLATGGKTETRQVYASAYNDESRGVMFI